MEKKLAGVFSRRGAAEHLYLLDAARDVLLDHQQDLLYEAVWSQKDPVVTNCSATN